MEVSSILKGKEGIGNKIKNVKQWLNSAEDSFAKDNAVRGHLDLMLAEAEMKYLRANTKNLWQNKYRLGLYAISICFMLTFVYWHFTQSEKIVNIIDDKTRVEQKLLSPAQPKNYSLESVAIQQSKTESDPQPIPAISTENQLTTQREEVTTTQKKFSEQEKQALVRQAQKGLQGYNKNVGGL